MARSEIGADRSVDRAAERSRRAFARRQWRRRWLVWRNVLVAVLVLGLAALTIWAVYFSSWLAVTGVRISGADTLSAGQVRKVAAVPTGGPLVSVDLTSVRNRVRAMADVESVDVSREWPHEVRIQIKERTPVAVVRIGDRLRGLDANGVVFRRYRSAPPGLPRVVTPAGTGRDALREAADVVAALPPNIARIVDHVEVRTVDQIELQLSDARRVVWGSAEDSGQKAQVLAALLPRTATTYDVSVPGQPTTK